MSQDKHVSDVTWILQMNIITTNTHFLLCYKCMLKTHIFLYAMGIQQSSLTLSNNWEIHTSTF